MVDALPTLDDSSEYRRRVHNAVQKGDFKEQTSSVKDFESRLKNNPDDVLSLLPVFYELLPLYNVSDLAPLVNIIAQDILILLPETKYNDFFDKILAGYQDKFLRKFYFKDKINDKLAQFLFNKIINKIKEANQNDYMRCIKNLIFVSSPQVSANLLDIVLKQKWPLTKGFFTVPNKELYGMAHLHSQLEDVICNYPVPKDEGETLVLLDNLSVMVQANPANAQKYLGIASTLINSIKSEKSLYGAYKTLEAIRINGNIIPEVDAVITDILKHPVADIRAKRTAYRIMGQYDKMHSRVIFGKKVPKTDDNKYGWEHTDSIKPDETCVLILGGSGAKTDRNANAYARSVRYLLYQNNIPDTVGVYSVIYDFGDYENEKFMFKDGVARIGLLQKYHRNVKVKSKDLPPDTKNPHYIQQIFDNVFMPRLCDKNGERYPVDTAIKNIRNITFVAHCHGAYSFIKLEEMMQDKMKEFGYSATERAQIQKQLMCVAFMPYCPLGVSKSTMLSFASANDDEIYHYNNFHKYVKQMKSDDEISMCFFPGTKGNFFLIPKVYEKGDDHGFSSFDTSDTKTVAGNIASRYAGNAVVNSINSALAGQELPDTKKLVCHNVDDSEQQAKNNKFVYELALDNGNKIYNKILELAKSKYSDNSKD